jgi:hypothetical protein
MTGSYPNPSIVATMKTGLLTVDESLYDSGRLPAIADSTDSTVKGMEIATLVLAGATAAVLTHVVRFRLGIPGSNIVFVAFPMAFGFALVPRRGAGTLMGGAALATTLALWLAGVRLDGVGAQTSLLLTGPLLDVALRRARGGWRLYVAFVVATAATNALAFAARASAKLVALNVAGAGGGRGGGGGRGAGLGSAGRALDVWLPQAVWTYALAGVVAGLISALAWFHFRERHGRADSADGA